MTDTSAPRTDESLDAEGAEPTAPHAGDEAEETGGTEKKAAGESDLFRQSEIAADYVEGLLDILDYDGDIDELAVHLILAHGDRDCSAASIPACCSRVSPRPMINIARGAWTSASTNVVAT